MKIGDSFTHPKWGRGVILSLDSRGRRLSAEVRFGFATARIPIEEIPMGDSLRTLVPQAKGHDGAVGSSGGSGIPRDSLAAARAGIQALKLGQVLESQVEKISVGTEGHEAAFTEAFTLAERRRPKLIVIEGAWGVGKTHLLTLLSALATKRQFAISTTILDGWAVSLADPMRLLESITSSIRFPGQPVPMGVGTMLGNIKRSGMPELRSLAGPRMVKLMEEIPQAALDDPDVVTVLEDYLGLSLPANQAREQLKGMGWRDVALPALRARNVDERGERLRELLCDWAAFCVASKAKGLLIVLDEVDVDYARAGWWNYQRRERHDSTLKALGALGTQGVPLVLAFGSAPAGPGEDASVDAVRDVIMKLGHVDVHEKATALDEKQLRELGQRVYSLYGAAYPGMAEKLTAGQLQSITGMLLKEYRRQLSPVPRRFVRSLLHCMDLIDLGLSSVDDLVGSRL